MENQCISYNLKSSTIHFRIFSIKNRINTLPPYRYLEQVNRMSFHDIKALIIQEIKFILFYIAFENDIKNNIQKNPSFHSIHGIMIKWKL
jgi:hypothetical protein